MCSGLIFFRFSIWFPSKFQKNSFRVRTLKKEKRMKNVKSGTGNTAQRAVLRGNYKDTLYFRIIYLMNLFNHDSPIKIHISINKPP